MQTEVTRRAFSLTELLVCIGIIVIVAAIVVPVSASVRHNARITSALMRLKQLHAAFKLYQADNGGDGTYGDCYDMNLPDIHALTAYRLGQSKDMWVSPCDTRGYDWSYLYWPNTDPYYAGYYRTYQEEAMLLSDFTCDTKQGTQFGDYWSTRGLGVRLSGQAINYYKPGNPTAVAWWHPGDRRSW